MNGDSHCHRARQRHLGDLVQALRRPGEHIGRIGDGSNANDGIYVLLKEIVDNAIDEYIMGHGQRFQA
jgi:topoisomerase-4 subunit B